MNSRPLISYSLLLVAAVIMTLLRAHSLEEVLAGDIAIYSYMAHEMISGKLLYTAIWDHKPPGLLWIFMLGEFIWGYAQHTQFRLGIASNLVSLFFIFKLIKELSGERAALLGALFFAIATNSVLLEANQTNSEVFLNTLNIVAFWAFVRHASQGIKNGRSYLFIAGAALALATTIKMVAIFPLTALAAYYIFTHYKEGKSPVKELIWGLILLCGPCGLIWSGLFIWFAALGRFGDFYEAVFAYNQGYSGSVFQNVFAFFTTKKIFYRTSLADIWVLGAASLAWILFSKRDYGPVRRLFIIVLYFGVMVEIASPGRYFAHYYQLAVPVFSIMSGLFLSDLYGFIARRRHALAGPLTGALSILILIALFLPQAEYLQMKPDEISRVKYNDRFIDAKKVALYIKSRTRSCETIYNWGDETVLHFYSKRSSASALFNLYPLRNDTEEGRNKKLARVGRELEAKPPSMIIWQENFPDIRGSVLEELIKKRYLRVYQYRKFTVYELAEGRPICGEETS